MRGDLIRSGKKQANLGENRDERGNAMNDFQGELERDASFFLLWRERTFSPVPLE